MAQLGMGRIAAVCAAVDADRRIEVQFRPRAIASFRGKLISAGFAESSTTKVDQLAHRTFNAASLAIQCAHETSLHSRLIWRKDTPFIVCAGSDLSTVIVCVSASIPEIGAFER